jgi:hypothetical protein
MKRLLGLLPCLVHAAWITDGLILDLDPIQPYPIILPQSFSPNHFAPVILPQ